MRSPYKKGPDKPFLWGLVMATWMIVFFSFFLLKDILQRPHFDYVIIMIVSNILIFIAAIIITMAVYELTREQNK